MKEIFHENKVTGQCHEIFDSYLLFKTLYHPYEQAKPVLWPFLRFCRYCEVRNSPRRHTVLSLGLTPYFQMVKLMLCWECDHIQVLYFA